MIFLLAWVQIAWWGGIIYFIVRNHKNCKHTNANYAIIRKRMKEIEKHIEYMETTVNDRDDVMIKRLDNIENQLNPKKEEIKELKLKLQEQQNDD